jgi:hypothetical protein
MSTILGKFVACVCGGADIVDVACTNINSGGGTGTATANG